MHGAKKKIVAFNKPTVSANEPQPLQPCQDAQGLLPRISQIIMGIIPVDYYGCIPTLAVENLHFFTKPMIIGIKQASITLDLENYSAMLRVYCPY